MVKYKEMKDAMEKFKLIQKNDIVVDKFFLLSIMEEVMRNRRKHIANSRKGSKFSPLK